MCERKYSINDAMILQKLNETIFYTREKFIDEIMFFVPDFIDDMEKKWREISDGDKKHS